jgi:hypothetical protein
MTQPLTSIADLLHVNDKDATAHNLLRRFEPTVRLQTNRIPPYFRGREHTFHPPRAAGHAGSRDAIGSGITQELERLAAYGIECLTSAFEELNQVEKGKKGVLIDLKLSEELQDWRQSQLEAGRALPSKGYGLTRVSDEVLHHLGTKG